jgi:hypothetical protein
LISSTIEPYVDYMQTCGTGIVQSVKEPAVGWTSGVQSPARERDFSILRVQTRSGPTQPNHLVPGSLPPEIKRPEHEVNLSLPSGA